MKSRALCFLVLVACVFLISVSANAAVIDFYGATQGGSVTINSFVPGTNTPASLTGSNIRLDTVQGVDTPLLDVLFDNGPYGLASGFGSSYAPYALMNFNTTTNTITITGRVPDFSNPTFYTDVTLLTGSFTSWTFSLVQPQNNPSYYTLVASGTDTKDGSLLNNFGLPADTRFVFSTFSIFMNPVPGNENTFVPYSTSVSNTAVPIPPALLLLAPGLVGLVIVRRRLYR